ncbi:MAG: adenylate/guanylate cyclase domain-containing protein [Thermomicrobiales bacterium]
MKPSEEIGRVFERWTLAIADGDHDSALGRLSNDPGTLIIGADPAEWWRGVEAHAIWARQIQEIGLFPLSATEIDAWEEGSVGWAGVKETIDWEGGTIEGRATYVLHLERGEWKVVHVHWSFPKAHVETLGRSLTVSLDDLEKAVQRERPDLSASFAADGTVTIVFTDIVDSTLMLSRLGDRPWLDVIRRHNRVINEVTAAHGGAVVETQGDGSMLAFSSARRAVACAQGIQQEITRAFSDLSPQIRVRIGIHTGDAIKDAQHFFGTTVHYAARVASHAVGGEVLVSSAAHELLLGATPSFNFLVGRDVELKGIAGKHTVYALEPG